MVRKPLQPATATQDWKGRMQKARSELPGEVGQQNVINWIVEQNPELDRLTFATRWRNAWLKRVADPEFTELVEKAAVHFKAEQVKKRKRLKAQKVTPDS